MSEQNADVNQRIPRSVYWLMALVLGVAGWVVVERWMPVSQMPKTMAVAPQRHLTQPSLPMVTSSGEVANREESLKPAPAGSVVDRSDGSLAGKESELRNWQQVRVGALRQKISKEEQAILPAPEVNQPASPQPATAKDDRKLSLKAEILSKTLPREPLTSSNEAGSGGFARLEAAGEDKGLTPQKPKRPATVAKMRDEVGQPPREAEFRVGGRGAVALDQAEQTGLKKSVREADDADGMAANASDALAAEQFMAQREQTQGVVFQEANGYWSSTYTTGDPWPRMLEGRLRRWDRALLGSPWREDPVAAAVAVANRQWLDPPSHAALSLFVNADRRAGGPGPTRMMMQVGMQGTSRLSGQRPAMRVGLVLDVRRSSTPQEEAGMRALVEALLKVREPGDRFALIVAGPGGGVVVPVDSFRHGPLQLALGQIFGVSRPATGVVTLPEAVTLAAAHWPSGSSRRPGEADPERSVLGSGLILLATADSLAGVWPEVEGVAHRSALDGMPVSAVVLGTPGDPVPVERVVLAGQGNRRLLQQVGEAESLVVRELMAASRAVARAVRMQIRLLPGVQLVEVLGSRRLDEERVRRVREMELVLDQGLSRQLGIAADRQQEDDGIQMVLPRFMAGDTHTIVLDLVASQPGPVADVTVKYKDLAYLRNGEARVRLTLPPGSEPPGRLERGVWKSALAHRFSAAVRQAAGDLDQGQTEAARQKLVAILALYRGLRSRLPEWSEDDELIADEGLLERYLALFGSRAVEQPLQLADALRYSAVSKFDLAGTAGRTGSVGN